MSQKSKVILAAYQQIYQTYGKDITNVKIKVPSPYCPKVKAVDCKKFDPKYRTYNGSCNNLINTWWGASETPQRRLKAPEYDDQVTEPRVRSVADYNRYLPNARKVVLNVFSSPQPNPISEWSHFMTYFGQFLDHDLSLTGQSTYSDRYRKVCKCGSYDPDCFNIPIPSGDYANQDQACMSFVRSSASIANFDCSLGPREQINLQTHWLDLSQLYGSTEELALNLRAKTSGLLRTSLDANGKSLLPLDPNTNCSYNRHSTEYSRRVNCFLAGDKRSEDNSILTAFHTLFLREHNRIAHKLKSVNPNWSDEQLYQESRKILTAVYQNIVYGEYLPTLLGPKVTRLYNLYPLKSGFFTGYRSDLYPQILNEFSTAAFRYGHTLLTNSLYSASSSYKLSDAKPMSFYQFNNQYYVSDMEGILRGVLSDWSAAPSAATNKYLADWLWDGIFSYTSRRWSLPALNIQRGRDHGLPGYNKYRQLCGLNEANKFEDLNNIPLNLIDRLRRTYASVDDIDLFTGISAEFPLDGAMVGATAACK